MDFGDAVRRGGGRWPGFQLRTITLDLVFFLVSGLRQYETGYNPIANGKRPMC